MTGSGQDVATSPYQVINNYTYIYNSLYDNMVEALKGAGHTDDYELSQTQGLTHSPDSFKITGIDKFVGSYYGLRAQDERYIHDIHGGPLYGAWFQSMGAGIQQDHTENQGSTNQIHKNAMEQLEM